MKKAFCIASLAALPLLFARATLAQAPAAVSQVLCTNDSISVSRNSKSLVEGLHSVALAWTASVSNPDYYKVYRGSQTGGPYTLIASCIQQPSYVDSAVSTGQDNFYVVTAVLGSAESANSNEAEAQIPVFDSISVVPNLQELPAESLTTSDGLAIRQVLRRSPSESLSSSISIALGVTSPPRSLNLSQSLTTSDAIGKSQVLGRAPSDVVSASDSAATSETRATLGSPSASLTTSDAIATQNIFQRRLSESLTGSVTLGVSALRASSLSSSLSTTDALQSSQVLGRGPSETISISDSIATSKTTAGSAPASETLTTSDAVGAVNRFQRSISETLSVSLSATAIVTPARSVNLSSVALVTSDALTSMQSLQRGPAETVSSSDALTVSKQSSSVASTAPPFWLTSRAAALPPQIGLVWTQSPSPGVSGTNVYRHSQQGGPYYLLQSFGIAKTSFTDLTVGAGTRYCYVITALSGNLESSYSNEACSTTPAGVSAPSALALSIQHGLPFLTWRQSATRMVTGNNIYRSTLSGGPYVLLRSFSSPATSFSDATASRGQRYFYVITAVAGSQESAYSNEAATVVP